MNELEILKKYFGYDSFRGGQSRLIDSILSGRDTMGIMPTGAGKSICYQLPALMMNGFTIVISPLISLMHDQVTTLVQAGVRAAYINSSLTSGQFYQVMNNARAGMYKIIYVAPERLESDLFLSFALSAPVSMVTVDEAHCISQWGQDFRPSYLNIPEFIKMLPLRPVVSAFTATATEKVRQDIEQLLELNDPFTLVSGFDRKNLYFEVRQPAEKKSDLMYLVKKYSDEGRSGIIYCSTRKNVEDVTAALSASGFSVSRYHAGLSEKERRENQEAFIYDRIKIMVATNAFGMGIDKSNITFVIHYNMPKDMESYYQEAGRAGRDGSPSDCILLYSGRDVVTAKFLINKSSEESELPRETAENVKKRDIKRLNDMIYYCTGADCLRHYILGYFGESSPLSCGNCSYCCSDDEAEDITVDAQKIMSCIFRAGQRYGVSTIISVLKGEKSEKITNAGLDTITTYGIMAGVPEQRIRFICDKLIGMGYVERTDDKYPVLKLLKTSAPVLLGKETIRARVPKAKEKKRTPEMYRSYEYDSSLMEQLKAVRVSLALKNGVPSYMILGDMSLREMCTRLPQTREDFLSISGVGEIKLERYGEDFLKVIRAHVSERSPLPTGTAVKPSRRGKELAEAFGRLKNTETAFNTEEEKVTVSALADKISSETGGFIAASPLRKAITGWLTESGYLTHEKDEKGHERRRVTQKGTETGICEERGFNRASGQPYIRLVYAPQAQQLIFDNIKDIADKGIQTASSK